MARALIVGCGCSGIELGAELRARGWQVRGTSRRREGADEIEAGGLEGVVADPDRPGTVLDLVADVSVVVWLLGSARGEPDAIAALHGPRLERLLERLVDTPVRGFVYEGAGTVTDAHLRAGRAAVERATGTWRVPTAVLSGGRRDAGWAGEAAETAESLLAGA